MIEQIHLTGKDYQHGLAFWETYFSSFENDFLFRQKNIPAGQRVMGRHLMVLPEEETSLILNLVKEDHSGIYVCILVALGIALKKYSLQEHVIINSAPMGNGLQDLPLCMVVNDTAVLREQLNKVNATLKDCYTYQDIPLPKGAYQSNVLLTYPAIHGQVHHDHYDLVIEIQRTGKELSFVFLYNTALFDFHFIDNLSLHLSRVISYYKNLDTPLHDIAILSTEERTNILFGFNNTATALPQHNTVLDLFEEKVSVTPNAVAVEYLDIQLTYAELNEKADRLAHHLVTHFQVGKDDIVGLMTAPSEVLIIAVLGILKSGAAYLPVDPALPDERKRFMLSDAGIKLLLTDTMLFMECDYYGEAIFLLDSSLPHLPEVKDPLHVARTTSGLAYVIYTSGTTGVPKGVLLRHGGLLNMVVDQIRQFGIRPTDKVLQFASVSFDAAVSEMCMALCSGAQLVMMDRAVVKDDILLLQLLEKAAITVLTLPPSYLNVIPWKAFAGLRVIISAGEKLHTAAAIYLSQYVDFFNAYGPTEYTVCATIHKIVPSMEGEEAESIGFPIANTEIYILGPGLEVMPVGAAGEIYIGGAGLAKGYLHSAELNTAKFIEHPFSNTSGAKLYRSGDLGKWLEDGSVVYMGRIDEQLKLRGYRVEPAEITEVLLQSGLVKHCVLVVKEDASGSKRLIAFVVPEDNYDRDHAVEYLSSRLPQYMIPAVWVTMNSIPLTNSGKVDKQQLLEWEPPVEDYTAPRNKQEEKLADIWKEVLELKQISIHDNFFNIGGDSLLAIRVLSAIREAFSLEISINAFFRYTSIQQLSEYITEVAGTGAQTISGQIIPFNREEVNPIPLSYAQERLWIMDQLMGSVHYHLPLVLRLNGPADRSLLESVIRAIVDRHEILRTALKEKDGVVYQEILPAGGWRFDDYEQDTLTEYIEQPFDLTAGYMLRGSLLKVSEDEHLLVVVMHHIASDGWSVSILVKEFIALYGALKHGYPAVLPALDIQYADYAVWQRQYLDQERIRQQLAYWEKTLAAAVPLELPVDHTRPVIQSTLGNVITYHLDNMLKDQLQELSRNEGVTLFMTLISAFNVLLFRYSGQEDLCVGTPVAGRTERATEGLIGFFVNMLVLRSKLTGSLTFRELLQQVKQLTLNAYEHQDIPFELVADHLVKMRDTSRNPLFQAAFILQNVPAIPAIALEDLTLQSEEPHTATSKFDISFDLTESDNGLMLRIEYSAWLFNVDTIHRMAAHYEQLLKAIVADPGEQIVQLKMLQLEEEQQLLQTFNDTAHSYPVGQTIISLFEEQVAKAEDETALVFKANNFTYSYINERANRLAAYLRHHYHIMPEDLIGIKLERSEWLIISLLGVLKSGAAYVPVDPAFPEERINYIIADSKCKLLLDDQLLKDFRQSEAQYSAENPPLVNTSSDLMYVIYTSGSTGRPKGVMVEHGGVINRLDWMWQHYAFSASDVILQKTTFTFDVSVWELFMPLCWGARMVLCEQDDISSPHRLQSLINIHKVSCLHFVPGMLEAFMGALFTGDQSVGLNSLRLVIASGEALKVHQVKQWYAQHNVPLHNLYGPTEASVDVTFYPTAASDNRIPIGRPIWNTRMLILGAAGELMPIGGIGEICIESIGLARGYLNNEALTAEKFVHHPFNPGQRMYRTSDYGRWLPDGNIEYLGRRDGQVKIRGYRIELGEIEAAINALHYIDACVVAVKSDTNGTPELVAYIISREKLDTSLLRAALETTLPAYMLPSHYVQLEQFPLTGSGKIDRKNLPEPADLGLPGNTAYVMPTGELEEELVLIWQDILGIPHIGVRDNFFELGGNSIKLIRMVSMINKKFNEKLTVVTAFKLPNVSAIAAYMRADSIPETGESDLLLNESVGMMKNAIHLLNKYQDEE